MKVTHFLPFLLALPLPVLACVAFPPSADEAAGGHVYIGYVTGEQYPDYEATLLKEGQAQYPRHGRHIVQVTPTEVLRGPPLGTLDVQTPCYAQEPSLGDRAIVIRRAGSDYVLPAPPEYESEIKAAISARGR